MASYRDFKGSAQDLLHMGNVDGVLLKDEKAGRDAYNDKLLKYNSRYAQLVGKQKANTEGIEEIFNSLPHVDLIDMIRKDIHELDEKQRSFLQHFEEFRGGIHDVTNQFINLRQSNGGGITDENLIKEQRQLQINIDKNENSLAQIRRMLNEDDLISKEVRKSHLFQ